MLKPAALGMNAAPIVNGGVPDWHVYRGTGQAIGIVADVGLFLDLLAKALA